MSLALAYYGDDFTGSTDVMEVLAGAGLRTVLFLQPPSPEHLAQFPGIRAFGIAGGSRMLSPDEMEKELPGAFTALRSSGAPTIHYKICSTFDSSPLVGSIGKAIEIGRRIFGEHPTPLVVGAPVLGRYVVFGNLFARSGLDSDPARLDRHPTMSRHPITPMDEADLRVHLARQTALPVELVDVLQLDRAAASDAPLEWTDPTGSPTSTAPPVILFDVLRNEHLAPIGRWLDDRDGGPQRFIVGSSGVEYALVAHWKRTGKLPNSPGESQRCAKPRAQVIGVSGSCSPVTQRQIGLAAKSGFHVVALDPFQLLQEDGVQKTLAAAEFQAAIQSGRSIILQTGHSTPNHVAGRLTRGDRQRISLSLGRILEVMLQQTRVRRAVVCGGDTSTGVARALGIEALEFLAPMAPGSPLCQVHAPGRAIDGCEMVFKGGQVGRDRFFMDALSGKPEEAT